jgi:peptidoglycan/LPS O-acetylase OafA/YrhL
MSNYNRIPELDGIRGIAILLVAFYHLYQIVPSNPATTALYHLVRVGWSGVDLFFVLSGFLITGILIDSRKSPVYFRDFYWRRTLRIFPLYFATLAFFFLIVPTLISHFGKNASVALSDQIWYWTYFSNWRSGTGHDIAQLTHMWSLSIEEQFYLLWPLIVWFLPSRWLLSTCIALIVLSHGAREWFQFESIGREMVYRLTPFRVEPLAFGAAIAVVVRHDALRAAVNRWIVPLAVCSGAILLGIMMKYSTRNTFIPMMSVGYSCFAVLYATLVFHCVTKTGSDGVLARCMRGRTIASWGKYSYGIYVFHWPVAAVLFMIRGKVETRFPGVPNFVMATAVCATGLGLSYLIARISWAWFEEPILRFKDRFRKHVAEHRQASVATA